MPGTAGLSTSVLDPILSAGPLARFVLGVLLFFSVICWALIVEKFWEFRAIKRESRAFTKAFHVFAAFSILMGGIISFLHWDEFSGGVQSLFEFCGRGDFL